MNPTIINVPAGKVFMDINKRINCNKLEKTIENQIKYYFENNKIISKEDLMIAIRNDFSNWSDNTINAYLYLLKKRGVINNLTRGIYTLGKVKTFNPQLS